MWSRAFTEIWGKKICAEYWIDWEIENEVLTAYENSSLNVFFYYVILQIIRHKGSVLALEPMES